MNGGCAFCFVLHNYLQHYHRKRHLYRYMLRRLFKLKPAVDSELMFYYAVRVGRQQGIFKSWAECEEQVKGYKGARFKKFKTRNEALNFIAAEDRPRSSPKVLQLHQNVNACPSVLVSPSNFPVVYTDGGCFKNGKKAAKAGIGVFWGVNDSRNVSERLAGLQTNQRAELNAAIRALETAHNCSMQEVELRTDSMYTINCATAWIKTWKRNGWRSTAKTDVKNKEDIQKLDELCNKIKVKWVHVRGHQGEFGNEQADRLSKEGARMD